MKKFKVYNNYILCKKQKEDNIFLIENEDKNNNVIKAQIIGLSDSKKIKEIDLKIGDIILFPSFSSYKLSNIKTENDMFFINISDVLAKIN